MGSEMCIRDRRSPIIALESVDEQMEYYGKKGKTDKVISLSRMVGDTTRHLNGLLDNLLSWALSQTGMIPYRPASLDVHQVAEDTLGLLRANATSKGITITNKLTPATKVYADADGMQTILRNLIGNALKFTPSGGDIIIASKTQGEYLVITITDTGSGMAPDRLNELFTIGKKNMKGTGGEKGTGLGLVLVKEIVELNKGTIEVESQLGKGSVFTVTFPQEG